jgi:predicted NBD/HSP70 family sugar kinase
MKKYLTIDLGSRWLNYGIVSEELDVLKEGKAYTSLEKKEDVFEPIRRIADACRNEIEGISMTMPGVIDRSRGYAYSGGVYLWVHDMEYAKELSAYTGIEKVALCNDAKAAALAEMGYGALKKVDQGALLMILTTGIGGALKINGKLLDGYHFAAGEFSYMKGDYQDRDQGQDMFALSCSLNSLTDLAKQASGDPKMNIIRIMCGLNEGDPVITGAVQKYVDRLSTFIYNIQCITDMERIVLGGTITDEPFMMDMIRKGVKKNFDHALYHNVFMPDIVPVTFHSNSRKFGAVYHFRQLFENRHD